MAYAFAKIAFTPTVRDQQDQNGSGNYAKFLSEERTGGDQLSGRERQFIQDREGFYQASVSETGWPYVQFRGGNTGFLNVLDPQTIAYADVRGNRQYISLGNLSGDSRISLILMDYAHAQRLKIWGRAEVVNPTDPDWATLPLHLQNAGGERVIKIKVAAFDWNCPKHIPHLLNEEQVAAAMDELRQENARLRAKLTDQDP